MLVATRSNVAHLARRAGFGLTIPEVDNLVALGSMEAVVDRFLDFSGAASEDATFAAREVWNAEGERWNQPPSWWFDRMAQTQFPLRERLAFFWHGHFCTGRSKTGPELFWRMIDVFRQHGAGSFVDLTQRVAVEPAMLHYLDNSTNRVGDEQENFARELWELFTLGVRDDAGNPTYTQDDIVASARAWTGHNTTPWPDDDQYRFYSDRHDYGAKTIFGTTRNFDGPDVVRFTLVERTDKRAIAARFIARKLWSSFAHPSPPEAALTAVANALLAGPGGVPAWSIRDALRVMFLREEFYDIPARQGLVRTPVELAVHMMRTLNFATSEIDPSWACFMAGQDLAEPPDVAGWKQNGYWISSTACWARTDLIDWITWSIINDREWLKTAIESAAPDAAVDLAISSLGIVDVSARTRNALITFVRQCRGLDGNRAAWGQYPYLLSLTMMSPEFQLA
jgi:uncharacterized protein (DUF1800 family)